MDILEKNNAIWPQIKKSLEELNCIGKYLTLKCQNHPEQLTSVQSAEDFLKISEGGCALPCQKLLECSHVCASMCHITDRDHRVYTCKERCLKLLCEFGHRCPSLCHMPCAKCVVPKRVELNCGHTHVLPCYLDQKFYECPTSVEVELECGHKVNKPCYRDIATFPCSHPCEIRRDCGHSCDKNCHVKDDPDHLKINCFKMCERIKIGCTTGTHKCPLRCHQDCTECEEKVKKPRTVCKHVHEVKCLEDVDKLICERRCDKIMACGHKCRKKCNEPCGDCKEEVTKIIISCGHTVKVKCCETPNRKNCRQKCPLLLPCGHQCQAKCYQDCTTLCRQFVDDPISGACGHTFKIPCSARNYTSNNYDILKYCTEPCNALLGCKHRCAGTCGKCAQGRIHISCQEQCGQIMVCGHACEIPCREACLPCKKKCTFRCVHSACGKNCGVPCVPCKERCTRR